MGRRLFEIQAARSRPGALANSAIYVVFSDAAGTVAADIAATVDGTSIPGSAVTTSDISGLGPGSVRFYGPPSGVDTLYVRSSSDATLGIQKIRADFDERIDVLVNEGPLSVLDPRVATTVADAGDDALAVQRAIDLAETAVSGSTGEIEVRIPAKGGGWTWKTGITWKGASLLGSDSFNGTVIYWGATGGTAITGGGTSYPGAHSAKRLAHLSFQRLDASHEPSTWLDLTAAGIDAHLQLERLAFSRSSGDCIKCSGWTNAHWRNLRFDGIGGYAIRLSNSGSQSFSSFHLSQFTYDHTRTPSSSLGMLLIDNSAGSPNVGPVILEGGRVEVNQPWAAGGALVRIKQANPADAESVPVALIGVSFADATGTPGVIFYRDTADVASRERLGTAFCSFNGQSAIYGGTWATNQQLPTTNDALDLLGTATLQTLIVRPASNSIGVQLRPHASQTSHVLAIYNKAGTEVGYVDSDGQVFLSTNGTQVPLQVNNAASGTSSAKVWNSSRRGGVLIGSSLEMLLVNSGGTTQAGLASGSGSPEGVVTAPIGSLYLRTDGSASTSLYVKESGAGNTGWVAQGAGTGLSLAPVTAPSAPASGATFYVDTADSQIKAVKASGDIIVFG